MATWSKEKLLLVILYTIVFSEVFSVVPEDAIVEEDVSSSSNHPKLLNGITSLEGELDHLEGRSIWSPDPHRPHLEVSEIHRLNREAARWIQNGVFEEGGITSLGSDEFSLMGDLLATQHPQPLNVNDILESSFLSTLKSDVKHAVDLAAAKGDDTTIQVQVAKDAIDHAVKEQKIEQTLPENDVLKMAEDMKSKLAKSIAVKVRLQKKIAKLANTDKFCALNWFRALAYSHGDLCGVHRKALAEKGKLMVYTTDKSKIQASIKDHPDDYKNDPDTLAIASQGDHETTGESSTKKRKKFDDEKREKPLNSFESVDQLAKDVAGRLGLSNPHARQR